MSLINRGSVRRSITVSIGRVILTFGLWEKSANKEITGFVYCSAFFLAQHIGFHPLGATLPPQLLNTP